MFLPALITVALNKKEAGIASLKEYYEYLGGDFVINLFFGYYLGGVIEK